MLHFLVTAIFEVRASSREAADHAATGVLQELRHPRIRYLEHNVSGSLGPARPGEDQFFTIIGDFDIDAPTTEKADDLVEETFNTLSTDFVQYLTHGLMEGEQGDQVEKEQKEEKPVRRRAERKERPVVKSPAEKKEVVETAAEEETKESPIPSPETSPSPAAPEPVQPPLFSPIRTTITITLQASELSRATDGAMLPDEEALLARAIEEARQRYPEIPSHLSPQSSFSPGSGEERLVTLTWKYEVPPSASPENQTASSDL